MTKLGLAQKIVDNMIVEYSTTVISVESYVYQDMIKCRYCDSSTAATDAPISHEEGCVYLDARKMIGSNILNEYE